ncbi:PhzF family phenazine biosynthesis protein [Salinicola avicenniae]|uniref:PhzF family phenazine biosynthesis protein n=1 Tax=Salinicola avicenniae TaxID=2916836 RepID=UPI002073465A|nr:MULTISPECIES: PhzF family phenazine biosynthesis protein [unclassified Salinicola]
MSESLLTGKCPCGGRAFRYVLLDVFTDTPFAGNPLAVFPQAAGLEDEEMARIARELNLSETVFIVSHHPSRARLRIFTPGGEIPFAGHPTIGTAWLIRALGWQANDDPLTLEEAVGDIPITFDDDSVGFTTAQPLEVCESSLTRKTASQVLDLPLEAIATAPVRASCGMPFHLIALRDLDALAHARVNTAALETYLAEPAERDLYLYVELPERALRTRLFAPAMGIPEDPATGSAAAPLIGYLATRASSDAVQEWTIHQGVEMGRPSRIRGRVDPAGMAAPSITITGQAVAVGEGTLYL